VASQGDRAFLALASNLGKGARYVTRAVGAASTSITGLRPTLRWPTWRNQTTPAPGATAAGGALSKDYILRLLRAEATVQGATTSDEELAALAANIVDAVTRVFHGGLGAADVALLERTFKRKRALSEFFVAQPASTSANTGQKVDLLRHLFEENLQLRGRDRATGAADQATASHPEPRNRSDECKTDDQQDSK
jgi:hypothetical protein